jgi:hypothetical protein
VKPQLKDPMPWSYKPTGPFYLVSCRPGLPGLDDEFARFDKLLDLFVRQCMMPDESPVAVITDNDGVAVVGWTRLPEYGLTWLGIDYGWKRMERYGCLDPLMIEEAKLSIRRMLGEVEVPA